MAEVQQSIQNTTIAPQRQNVVHWVKPAQPGRLDGVRSMPIPGMDQIWFPMQAAFVYPGKIDIDRYLKAMALTMALWPTYAGRLKKTREGTWKMVFNNPVPVTVRESDLIVTEESLREGIPELGDAMPWSYAPPEDMETQPLARWTITWLPQTGDTSIVLDICHVLGDGGVTSQMQCTVSDFYEGKTTIEHPLPTHEKYFEQPRRLPKERFDEILHRHIPNLINDYDPKTFMEMAEKEHDATERVDLVFTLDQLKFLQQIASEQAGTGKKLSRGDVLVGYCITLFNRIYPYTFNKFMNVVHTRGRKSPPDAEYQLHSRAAAGNAIFHSVSEPFPDEYLFNMGALAMAVRYTINKVDNYEFLRDCMSVCEQRYDEMNAKGHLPWMMPGPRTIGANLLHRAPIASFGYGKNVRFFTYPPNVHHVRAFPANPVKLADGTWRLNTGGMFVLFSVRAGYAEKFQETVRRDLEDGFAFYKGKTTQAKGQEVAKL